MEDFYIQLGFFYKIIIIRKPVNLTLGGKLITGRLVV